MELLFSFEHFFLVGVFLHVMADTLGSIGVIISAGLIKQFGKLYSQCVCVCVCMNISAPILWWCM